VNVWAIVPIKPLMRSKSRLAPVMDVGQREALSREMLTHTLAVLSEARTLAGILVVSRDSAALSVARNFDVRTIQEGGAPELNTALARATKVTVAWGARGTLVLPSDLPLLQVEDVEAILENSRFLKRVVVAPDRHGDGTNALLMTPPGLIEYGFGKGSFARHVQRAEQAGAEVRIYRSPTVELDLDTPEDLELYRAFVEGQDLGEPAWPASTTKG
jgi:2-phospho-L-lactate guanylyltransferase